MSERAYEIMDPDGRAGSGSLAAQLRALHANLISARGWHVQYLLAAADRLDTLEQEKARDGNYHISKKVELRESLAACQRELAKAREEAEWKAARVGEVVTPIIQRAEAAEAERDKLLRDRGWQTTQCAATTGHPDARCGLEAGHDGQHFCGDPRTGYGYRWPISHAQTQ